MADFEVRAALKRDYDAFYSVEDVAWRRMIAVEKAKNVQRLCASFPHETVIDIGCGEGSVLERLSEIQFARKYYGIEISQSGVDLTLQKNIPDLAECRLFDGYTLPYDDQTFDVAVLSHVVEHLEFPRRMLYEAARVARHVFVEVPLEDHFLFWFVFGRDYGFSRDGHISHDGAGVYNGHVEYFSLRNLLRLARTSNLDVLDHAVTNFPLHVYRHIHGPKAPLIYYPKLWSLKLFPMFARNFWTFNCCFVARGKSAQT